MITREQLTEAQKTALKNVDEGKYPEGMTYELWCDLDTMGLLNSDEDRETVTLTGPGKRVLAEAAREKAQPVVISAREFVEQGYAAKIAADECDVTDFDGDKVESIELSSQGKIPEWFKCHSIGRPYWGAYTGDDTHDIFTVTWLSTPPPAPDAGEAFVNPTRAYEETLSRDELLKRLDDQDRIIHELYTGKHGVIPHPSEVYQAGLWEIYKVDEHQGHAERVGDVGNLATLRAQLAASSAASRLLLAALDNARQSFVTIQAYPDVESDMEVYHQIKGMIQQAEFGAEQAAAALQAAGESEVE